MYMTPSSYDEKEYNPAESRTLAEWSPGGLRDETETLYKTGRGNFFILVQAGIVARHRLMQAGEDWYGGASIRPVTPGEARAWCEETGNYDVMNELVPPVAMLHD